jgi:hypothetical protein
MIVTSQIKSILIFTTKYKFQDGVPFSPGVVTKYEPATGGNMNVKVRWNHDGSSNMYMYSKALSVFHIQLQQAPEVNLVRMILRTMERLIAPNTEEEYKDNPFTKEIEKNNGASLIKSLKEFYQDDEEISTILHVLIKKCQESDIFLAIEYKAWSLAISLSATCKIFVFMEFVPI